MQTVKWIAAVMLLALLGSTGYAQQLRLGNNPYGFEKSAVLELQSTNQGLLFPRIADTTLINALSPPDGMVIYHTQSKQLLLRVNGYWNPLSIGGSLNGYWSMAGNTTGGDKKIGSTDNYALSIITNNTERMKIAADGSVGIGIGTPTALLHLKAGSATANTAPLKFTSGPLMATAQAGAVEFLTDKFYGTISTGSARKEFTLNDAALTAGRVPVVTTNGRLTSNANFVWNNTNSRLGLMQATPTAYLHLGAGTSTPNAAPLKFTAGINLATPEAGALEFDGSHFYGTIGSTRYQLDQQVSGINPADFWSINGNTVGSEKTLGTVDNISLPFITNNTERMRIDNNGKVGIGTASIASQFHVKTPGAAGPISLGLFEGSQNAGAGNYGYLQVMNSSATNSKTALVLGGAASVNQWLIGTDAFGNKAQNFYIYDAATGLTRIFIDNLGNVGVGNYTFTPSNPEKFVVDAGNTASYNVISGKGTIDNYLQLNIQNKSNGTAASSDLVATADNGTETVNYVDLGINSSNYASGGILGGINNAYLYSTGNDFMIGNATANKNLLFFTGGANSLNERMRIDGAGKIGIATTSPGNYLEVAGTNTTTGVSGLRLTNLGTATAGTANTKMLTVNASGDVIVTNNPASTNWLFTGNSGINPATNFLGTTDDKQMVLKSNNQSYLEFGRRQTLGLTQGYTDYDDNDEKVTYIRSALQFQADAASFYKPKMYTDVNGNFRVKGSSAGTDYFEFGSTGTNNNGGFEFIIGDDGDEPILFKSYHYINGMSEIMRLQSGRMAVGSNAFDATNPEKLLIDAGNTSSYNLMTGKGSIDNYLQINVQNRSAGGSASSDIVATSNNGTESSNYIDMGINGGGYTNTSMPMLAGVNTAYLYSTGNDFVIGNGTSGKNIRFFTGGFANSNERVRIDGAGNVGIGTTSPDADLDVSGTFKLGTAGTVLNSIIKGSISISDFTNFGQASTRTISTTVTGATVNGAVIVNPRSSLTNGIAIAWARVSAANTVTIGFTNTNGFTSSLGSVTFDVTIIQ